MQFPIDIQNIIALFIDNFDDFKAWRHTCSSHLHKYVVTFTCTNIHPFTDPISVKITERTNIERVNQSNILKSVEIVHFNPSEGNKLWLHNLDYLNISNFMGSNIDMFIHLSNLQHFINSSIISDEILLMMPNLVTFEDINSSKITERSLSTLTNLTSLKLGNYSKYNSLSFIKKLTKLESLMICGNRYISDDDIIDHPSLKIIRGSKIGPKALKSLKNLEEFTFSDSEFTDEHIQHLVNLKILRGVRGCFFTEVSFSNLSKLEIICADNMNLSVKIETLHKLTNLIELKCGSWQIPDIGFAKFSKMLRLDCGRNTSMTDTALFYMPNLVALKCGVNITDVGVSSLKYLEELTCNDKLTDNAIINLPRLRALRCNDNVNFRMGLFKISKQLLAINSIIVDFRKCPEFGRIFRRVEDRIVYVPYYKGYKWTL